MIPDDVSEAIQQATGHRIEAQQSVSGGSINQTAKTKLSNGKIGFLKWNTSANPDMFDKEKEGLRLLRSAETSLRIPGVIATGKTDQGTGYLLLEYLQEGRAKSGSAEAFGQELARMHKVQNDKFGLGYDNYIGRLPQSNSWHQDWTEFFIEQRMKPQLRMAINAGKLSSQTAEHFEALYKKLPDIFPDAPPSLLHGDLWGGNFFYDKNGEAAIYDPAIYYGNRGIELAFTHLFGGFSNSFYNGYEEVYPLESGFKDRKDVYNLYPLLVHTNLFGGSYAHQVQGIVRQY